MTALPEERLGQLRVAKLRALLGARDGAGAPRDETASGPFGTGAALLDSNGRAAILIEDATERSLGGAVTWAVRKGATELLVIADADEATCGHLAREAGWFDLPITVERIAGTTVVATEPAPFPPLPATEPLVTGFEDLLAAAEVDVIVEHGVTRAEVLGLEVARVVTIDGELRLEVGVGRFDREISAMMFSNVPTADALSKAVAMVREYRRPGGTPHPLRDLVPERWLRCVVLDDPSLVGATALRAVDSTVEPANLRVAQPAAAAGTSVDGSPLVVVCTAAVDLDAVTLAADTRAWIDPGAELVICGPGRNLIAAVRAVSDRLTSPARFVPVDLPY